MTTTIYDVGDKIRLSFEFTDFDGVYADPTTVQIVIKNGNSIVEDYTYSVDVEVNKSETGKYYVDFIIPAKGYWSYVVYGTGALTASDTEFFIAKA